MLPGHELTHGQSVTVHHGTAHTPARVAIAAGEPLQLRLQRPMLAAAGDPVIVRLTAPPTTITGGRVLHPHPRRARPEPQPSPPPAAAAPDRSADEDALFARLAEWPAIAAADEELVAALVQQGRVVRAGRDLAFTREAFEAATSAVLELAAREQGRITLAEARDRLGYSRGPGGGDPDHARRPGAHAASGREPRTAAKRPRTARRGLASLPRGCDGSGRPMSSCFSENVATRASWSRQTGTERCVGPCMYSGYCGGHAPDCAQVPPDRPDRHRLVAGGGHGNGRRGADDRVRQQHIALPDLRSVGGWRAGPVRAGRAGIRLRPRPLAGRPIDRPVAPRQR